MLSYGQTDISVLMHLWMYNNITYIDSFVQEMCLGTSFITYVLEQ